MQHQVEQQRRLIDGDDLAQGRVEYAKVDLETDRRIFGWIRGVCTLKQTRSEVIVLRRIVVRQDQDEQQALVGQRKVFAEREHHIR